MDQSLRNIFCVGIASSQCANMLHSQNTISDNELFKGKKIHILYIYPLKDCHCVYGNHKMLKTDLKCHLKMKFCVLFQMSLYFP